MFRKNWSLNNAVRGVGEIVRVLQFVQSAPPKGVSSHKEQQHSAEHHSFSLLPHLEYHLN